MACGCDPAGKWLACQFADNRILMGVRIVVVAYCGCDPAGKWLACQSMDNRILIFGVHNNYRLNRRKSFRGHMVAGYSCVPDFSPDGR